MGPLWLTPAAGRRCADRGDQACCCTSWWQNQRTWPVVTTRGGRPQWGHEATRRGSHGSGRSLRGEERMLLGWRLMQVAAAVVHHGTSTMCCGTGQAARRPVPGCLKRASAAERSDSKVAWM